MGASNHTYVEATMTHKLADFIGSTIRSLEYFGAVPLMLVPDRLRSGVSGPDRYDPDINRLSSKCWDTCTKPDRGDG